MSGSTPCFVTQRVSNASSFVVRIKGVLVLARYPSEMVDEALIDSDQIESKLGVIEGDLLRQGVQQALTLPGQRRLVDFMRGAFILPDVDMFSVFEMYKDHLCRYRGAVTYFSLMRMLNLKTAPDDVVLTKFAQLLTDECRLCLPKWFASEKSVVAIIVSGYNILALDKYPVGRRALLCIFARHMIVDARQNREKANHCCFTVCCANISTSVWEAGLDCDEIGVREVFASAYAVTMLNEHTCGFAGKTAGCRDKCRRVLMRCLQFAGEGVHWPPNLYCPDARVAYKEYECPFPIVCGLYGGITQSVLTLAPIDIWVRLCGPYKIEYEWDSGMLPKRGTAGFLLPTFAAAVNRQHQLSDSSLAGTVAGLLRHGCNTFLSVGVRHAVEICAFVSAFPVSWRQAFARGVDRALSTFTLLSGESYAHASVCGFMRESVYPNIVRRWSFYYNTLLGMILHNLPSTLPKVVAEGVVAEHLPNRGRYVFCYDFPRKSYADWRSDEFPAVARAASLCGRAGMLLANFENAVTSLTGSDSSGRLVAPQEFVPVRQRESVWTRHKMCAFVKWCADCPSDARVRCIIVPFNVSEPVAPGEIACAVMVYSMVYEVAHPVSSLFHATRLIALLYSDDLRDPETVGSNRDCFYLMAIVSTILPLRGTPSESFKMYENLWKQCNCGLLGNHGDTTIEPGTSVRRFIVDEADDEYAIDVLAVSLFVNQHPTGDLVPLMTQRAVASPYILGKRIAANVCRVVLHLAMPDVCDDVIDAIVWRACTAGALALRECGGFFRQFVMFRLQLMEPVRNIVLA